jgi:hypothetical protein
MPEAPSHRAVAVDGCLRGVFPEAEAPGGEDPMSCQIVKDQEGTRRFLLGWGTQIRTVILGFKDRCPTFGRYPNC